MYAYTYKCCRYKRCKDALDAGLALFGEKKYQDAIAAFNLALELPGNGAYRLPSSPREYRCGDGVGCACCTGVLQAHAYMSVCGVGGGGGEYCLCAYVVPGAKGQLPLLSWRLAVAWPYCLLMCWPYSHQARHRPPGFGARIRHSSRKPGGLTQRRRCWGAAGVGRPARPHSTPFGLPGPRHPIRIRNPVPPTPRIDALRSRHRACVRACV